MQSVARISINVHLNHYTKVKFSTFVKNLLNVCYIEYIYHQWVISPWLFLLSLTFSFLIYVFHWIQPPCSSCKTPLGISPVNPYPSSSFDYTGSNIQCAGTMNYSCFVAMSKKVWPNRRKKENKANCLRCRVAWQQLPTFVWDGLHQIAVETFRNTPT